MAVESTITALAAVLAAGLFTGAAAYITLVEHPARVSCGTAVAIAEFRPSYRRATLMQAPLALIGALAGMARWALGGHLGWLVGGTLLASIVPITLIVIMPTNQRLLDPALDVTSPEAAALLGRWGRLHALRVALGAIAFVTFVGLTAG